jgi:hypothetical protein
VKDNSRNGTGAMRIYLPSVNMSVRAGNVLDDPMLAALVVEDTCWHIAEDDWITRQPRGWQRRRIRRWEAEHAQLHRQRNEIRALARRCGLLRSAG